MHRVAQGRIDGMWGMGHENKGLWRVMHQITNDKNGIMAGCLSATHPHSKLITLI